MTIHETARFAFKTGSPVGDLDVIRFTGDEAVSQPFRFEIDLVADDPDIAFADVVNQPATLWMERGDERTPVHGIVADFQQGRQIEVNLGFRYLYRAVLVPRLHRLSLSSQSRIFQNLTVEEIVTQVLADSGLAGPDVEFHLDGAYAPREYCTQYKETDLQFVQRLLEFEGIRYHFQHDDAGEVLVLTDTPAIGYAIAGDATVPYHLLTGMTADDSAESISEFVSRQQIVTGRVVIKDYNYRTPEASIQSESQLNADMPGVFYDYGIHAKDAAESARLATVRNEELECQREVMAGTSDCLRFRTGETFDLDKHYRDGLNQSYLITHVHHEGHQPDADPLYTGGEVLADYTNAFTCVPRSAPYRPPRRTPEPKLPGVLTAMVESGGGEYAYLDDQGRYRIKMPFDLSDATDGGASKAVRLAQPYSGPGYGQHFPVHKGAEMLVACVDGNVDRVLGLSTIHNPTQGSPVASGNPSDNVLRSWGKNELTFRDKQGAEEVFMNATKDHTVAVANDEGITVGNNQTITVGSTQTISVGANRDKTVGADQTEAVGANKTISVVGNHDETIGGNQTETVGGNLSQMVGASKTETIAVAKALTIGAAYQVSVGAAENHTVGGLLAQEVGGAKTVAVGAISSENVGLNKSVSAGGSISESAGTSFSCQAGTSFSAQAGDDVSVQAGSKMSLTAGDDVSLSGGKKGVITIADELTIQCGSASISMKKNGDIVFKGKDISLDGSGKIGVKASSDVKIDGSKVAIK